MKRTSTAAALLIVVGLIVADLAAASIGERRPFALRLLYVAADILPASSASAATPVRATGERITIVGTERPTPYLNLMSEAAYVPVEYGAGMGVDQLAGATSAHALASADFDEDGVPDLVGGYSSAGGAGVITIQRGNVDAIYPNSPEARERRGRGEFIDAPFHLAASAFVVPEAASVVGAGDFDADGHWDVVAARRNGNALYFLRGDGRGNLGAAERIELPGALTAFTTGEMNRRDGLTDIVVAISGNSGPSVLVFESPAGALRGQPESLALQAPASGLALGALEADAGANDLAIAAGAELLVVHGRDRRLSVGAESRAGSAEARVSRSAFEFTLAAVAVGDFAGDERADLAVLSTDGAMQVLTHAGSEKSAAMNAAQTNNAQPKQLDDEATDTIEWQRSTEISVGVVESTTEVSGSSHVLVTAKVSSLGKDDLLVLGGGRAHVITNELARVQAGEKAKRGEAGDVEVAADLHVAASIGAESEVAAVLPMRLNASALSSLVVLGANSKAPSVMSPEAAVTFTVNSAADTGDANTSNGICADANGNCTFRAALDEIGANAFNPNAGPYTINFNIPGAGVPAISTSGNFPSQNAIHRPVVIDGTTQAAGRVEIIDTTGHGGLLQFHGGNSTVRGLVMSGAATFGGSILLSSGNNIVEGCYIGTNADGTAVAARRSGSGISVNGSNNRIGGTSPAARNLISGVLVWGIHITAGSGNLIEGNYIGTNAAGTAAISNGGGIRLAVSGNTVGGTAPGAGNLLSGNGASENIALYIRGVFATVQGNLFGTNASGDALIGNNGDALYVSGSGGVTTIGGTTPAARNIVSGSTGRGIFLESGADPNLIYVQGNYVGTNADGTVALPNLGHGIFVSHQGITVGGTAPGAGNLVSGNSGDGIHVNGQFNTVQGNLVGTDVSGTLALPNGGDGVEIQNNGANGARGNLIGGTAPAARNVISGNLGNGINFNEGGAGNPNRAEGNYIGTNRFATGALGNGQHGIYFNASGHNVGGTSQGAANLIAYNSGAGIASNRESIPGAVLSNSIHSNAELGIDVGDNGISAFNGESDANAPVLTSVTNTDAGTTITGTTYNFFTTLPNTIQFFSNPACDPSGSGEGQTLIGQTTVPVSAQYVPTNFSHTISPAIPAGTIITAVALRAPDANRPADFVTSEFSNCMQPFVPPPPGSCFAPPTSLAAWYRAEGNANDFKGTSHATLQNGATFAAGKVGQAFLLDGTNDRVLTPTLNLGSQFSIELWMQPTSNARFQHVVSNGFSSVNYGALYFHVDHLEYWQGGTRRVSSPTIPLNQLAHVALVYDGSVVRLYVNGQTAGTSGTHAQTFNNAVMLGFNIEGESSHFAGLLDEVSFYNSALSHFEVQSIHFVGSTGKCTAAPTPTPTPTPSPGASPTPTPTPTPTPVPLQLFVIAPNRGGDAAAVSRQITGQGFLPGAIAKLTRAGQPDIVGTATNITNNGTTLTATFDLIGKARGTWSVVVTNPGGATATLADAFTIGEARPSNVWADFVGRFTMRLGRAQRFYVAYGNTGDVEGPATIVQLFIPHGLTIEELPPPTEGVGVSVINLGGTQILQLYIEKLPANSSFFTPVRLNTPLELTHTSVEFRVTALSADSLNEAFNPPPSDPTTAIEANVLINEPGRLKMNAHVTNGAGQSADYEFDYTHAPSATPEELEYSEVDKGDTIEYTLTVTTPTTQADQRAPLQTATAGEGEVSPKEEEQPYTKHTVRGNSPKEANDLLMRSPEARPQLMKNSLEKELTRCLVSNFILKERMLGEYTEIERADLVAEKMQLLMEYKKLGRSEGWSKAAASLLLKLDNRWANQVTDLVAREIVDSPAGKYPDPFLIESAKEYVRRHRLSGDATLTESDTGNLLTMYLFILDLCKCRVCAESRAPSGSEAYAPRCTAAANLTGGSPENELAGVCPTCKRDDKIINRDVVRADDPNDKVGSQGVGSQRFITSVEPMPYTIFFENKPTATAPAQDVIITDQLDASKYDLSTFQLGPVAFGKNTLITPPPGLSQWATDVDLRPANNLIVRINAGLNLQTGVVRWSFISLDPATMLPTEDPLAGFLPPNKTAPEGEGSVTFTVSPKEGIQTGDEVRNGARIVFDVNAPIDTPQWLNTIDTSLPTSKVSALAATQPYIVFYVNWEGTDTGSGLQDYTIFFSEDGGPYNIWLSETSNPSGIFIGKPGKTYSFYAVASDKAGNVEQAKTSPEATTTTPNVVVNALDDARFFVLQHYRAFFGRDPDASGFDFWTNQIAACGTDVGCLEVRRINVSASFFLSIEFQQTGYLVERSYKSAYGDATGNSTFGGAHQLTVPLIRFSEFRSDTLLINEGVIVLQTGWEQQLENNKQAFFLDFVQRARFTTALPTSMTPAQFVDALNANAGNPLSSGERATAINLFSGASDTTNMAARAQVLRQVAEDPDLYNAEFNRAFVLMQYFGYLIRNPNDAPDADYTGYDFWLTKLNQFNGNYINAEMVKAFITSIEYRQRFGP